jgi:hypothetical protein
LPPARSEPVEFVRDIQPLFAEHCLSCHGPDKQKGGYRLDVKSSALEGGDSHAPNIIPGKSADSPLIHFVGGLVADMKMPGKGDALSLEKIALLRAWIDQGAAWPDEASAVVADRRDWWSLRPLTKPLPPVGKEHHPIDAFISATREKNGLQPSPPADPRTLCRRVYMDLTGLPPTMEQVETFVKEFNEFSKTQPAAGTPTPYDRLVDTLLASPRYGERWARHWLDVVHYGDTHGYDKDKPRPNAWPYRDYVIRSFNEDKPYARFIEEQIAGDVLYEGTKDGIEALGFIAAGPWDYIGHAEVSEDKIDGKIARHLDRDDMVANTMNTFVSLTVHCAQCHDHKFDPVSAADYYALQAVFAALDRADRPYDTDPAIAEKRTRLTQQKAVLTASITQWEKQASEKAGVTLTSLDETIKTLSQPRTNQADHYGWHSALTTKADEPKWVQIDLGQATSLSRVELHPCEDDFNNIGKGFGFPLRYLVQASNDPDFTDGVISLADESKVDFPNPGINPVVYETKATARFIRITAVKLAERMDDFMMALAEVEVFDAKNRNLALRSTVTSLDSIEAPVRWSQQNLTDGSYPGAKEGPVGPPESLAKLQSARQLIIESMIGETGAAELAGQKETLAQVEKEIGTLPPAKMVYSGTIHHGSGTFMGTGAAGGKPRPIHVLARGDVTKPRAPAPPGAIDGIGTVPARFSLPPDAGEGQARAALAHWLSHKENPLTWRSLVNRVWHYHFGRGIVDTPNDFGRMGGEPSHPELLDWLAVTFRDDMQGSLKQLHRLIVTSETYRQSSFVTDPKATEIDSGNRFLWRQNRRKLEAEAVRDSILLAAGKLDLSMGGPGFQDFEIRNPEHSPHYEYDLANPEDPKIHRRSVYRFIVRSKQQPWMASLDCADPSLLVDKRNQTVTPLQALAQMNNQLMIAMSVHFAERVEKESGPDASLQNKIERAFSIALQRNPEPEESKALMDYAQAHGMANACRLLINVNEFVFFD